MTSRRSGSTGNAGILDEKLQEQVALLLQIDEGSLLINQLGRTLGQSLNDLDHSLGVTTAVTRDRRRRRRRRTSVGGSVMMMMMIPVDDG